MDQPALNTLARELAESERLREFVAAPAAARVSEPLAAPIRATTRLCAVFGHPIGHSASPAMQNAGIAALGLDRFLGYIKGVQRYLGIVSVANGILLIIFGLVLYTNSLGILTAFFEQHGIGWYFGLDGSS